jgi:hypothetical protein
MEPETQETSWSARWLAEQSRLIDAEEGFLG